MAKVLFGHAGLSVHRSQTAGLRIGRWEVVRARGAVGLWRPFADMRACLSALRSLGFAPQGIMDIGACRGKWAELVRDVFPEAQLLLIEPQDELGADLQALCAALGRAVHLQVGVARESGNLPQAIHDDVTGSSFLLPETTAGERHELRSTRVVSIDDLLQTAPAGFRPDLVKMDIQGFELEALHGASALYGVTEVFIIEVSFRRFMKGLPLAREIIGFLGERGYELYDVAGFLRRPSDGALAQMDLVFARAGGPLMRSCQW